MAHDSKWINWRKPRLERDYMWQTERPAIPVRIDKTGREAVLKLLVSSPFDSRLSVMEHLQGLFALLQITTKDVSATKEAIYQAAQLFQTRQDCKRLLREIQRPDKRAKHSPVDVATPLANITKEESALLKLWTKEVKLALLSRNKPLKVWTTNSRLLTLAVRRYKKVANKAKQIVINKAKKRKARGHAVLNKQVKRKIKGRKNDSEGKQVVPCRGPKLSTIDGFIAKIYLSTTTKPTHLQETTKTALKPHDLYTENVILPKKGNATAKPQAKVRPTRAKDEVEPDMTQRVPVHRKRKGDTTLNGEPTANNSLHSVEKKSRSDTNTPSQVQHDIPNQKCRSTPTPQKIAYKEPIATKPSNRYKYIKDNANTANSGSLAEWLRPQKNATTGPRSPHTQAISTNRKTICLRPQDNWMVKKEYTTMYPAEHRNVCLRPHDKRMGKSEPISTYCKHLRRLSGRSRATIGQK